MKPFLLFAGEKYYPLGGWDDFKGDFEQLDQAMIAAEVELNGEAKWAHIITSINGEKVWHHGGWQNT